MKYENFDRAEELMNVIRAKENVIKNIARSSAINMVSLSGGGTYLDHQVDYNEDKPEYAAARAFKDAIYNIQYTELAQLKAELETL